MLNDGRLVAEGTAAELKAGVGRATDGAPADAHDVFMAHTGRSLDDDVEDERRRRRIDERR